MATGILAAIVALLGIVGSVVSWYFGKARAEKVAKAELAAERARQIGRRERYKRALAEGDVETLNRMNSEDENSLKT